MYVYIRNCYKCINRTIMFRGCRRSCIKYFGLVFVCVSIICGIILTDILLLWNGDPQCQTQNNIGTDLTKTEFPKKIHQCFFGVDTHDLPTRFENTKREWQNRYALTWGYENTLWNASMVETLIARTIPV